MNEKININTIFFQYLKENPFIFIIYVLLLSSYPLYKVTIPKYYGKVISNLKSGPSMNTLKDICKLLALFSLYQILASLMTKIQGMIVPKISEFSISKIFNNLMNNKELNYENLEVGEILAKLIKVPNIIYKYLDLLRSLLFSQLAVFLVCLYHYYKVSVTTMLYFIFLVVGVFILQILTYKLTMNIEIQREINKDRIYQHIQDVLNNLISVVVCKNEKNEDNLLHKKFKPFIDVFNKSLNMNFIMRIIFSLFNIFAFILLNYQLYKEYINKNINKEQFVSSFIVTYSILSLFNEANYSVRSIVDMFSQVKDMENFFNSKQPGKNVNNQTGTQSFKKGSIVFKNVSYKYEGNEDFKDKYVYALKNINLEIKDNENIAIIGQIGSGKSTLVKLLLKLMTPSEGEILINNININDISRDELYDHVFYIPQKPKLLDRTLYENIIYGYEHKIKDKNKTINFINQKLKEMEIEQNIIDIFMEKMDQPLGNDGVKLSGGQRQMVWIIRALLRDPSIIIFDEPTSALDKKNKNKIINLIKKVSKDKTVIIISHDDIDNDFRKIELKQGEIISSNSSSQHSNNLMYYSW